MPLYWLVYRHNNSISIVIEPGASPIHASKPSSCPPMVLGPSVAVADLVAHDDIQGQIAPFDYIFWGVKDRTGIAVTACTRDTKKPRRRRAMAFHFFSGANLNDAQTSGVGIVVLVGW
jgi:hypothetical protein